jgi:phage-related protein
LTVQNKSFQFWKLLLSLQKRFQLQYFKTRFLEEADKFIAGLDPKAARKVFYNIDLAEQSNDPRLFKKLQKDIWEFRTKFGGVQIRLLAFWDKDKETETLVFATHGFIKKVDKVPANEIERAINIRKKYFESKLKK